MSERGPLLPFLLSLDPNFSSVACPVFGMSMMSKLLAWVLCRTVMWSFAGWNPSFRGAALRRGSPRCLCSSRRRCLRPSGRNSSRPCRCWRCSPSRNVRSLCHLDIEDERIQPGGQCGGFPCPCSFPDAGTQSPAEGGEAVGEGLGLVGGTCNEAGHCHVPGARAEESGAVAQDIKIRALKTPG